MISPVRATANGKDDTHMKDTEIPGGSSGGADRQELEAYILQDTSCLIFYGRRLYQATGNLCSYMNRCCKERVKNKKRIEGELESIRELIRSIENELKYL